MRNRLRLLIFSALLILASGCGDKDFLLSDGVSKELALYRKGVIDSVIYNLHFDIPPEREDNIESQLQIELYLKDVNDVILDFKFSENN